MKKSLIALCGVAALGACSVSYPQTAADMKGMAATSPLVARETYTVSRSPAAVANRFSSLSRQCLNRTTRSNMAPRQTQFGVQSTPFVTRWDTTVRSSSGTTELAMRMIPIQGSVNEPREGYVFFVAEAAPGQGGTTISHYQGSIGAGTFSNGVKAWINGSNTCPDMPR